MVYSKWAWGVPVTSTYGANPVPLAASPVPDRRCLQTASVSEAQLAGKWRHHCPSYRRGSHEESGFKTWTFVLE